MYRTQREQRDKADYKPSRNEYLKTLGVPWHYRNRFINWLMAKPWRWHYRNMYQAFRLPAVYKGVELSPSHGRLRSAWFALTFPHVHHEKEE